MLPITTLPATVGTALADDLFVPKAERQARSLHRYRVYRLVTIHWSPSASAQDRVGCHSVRHSAAREPILGDYRTRTLSKSVGLGPSEVKRVRNLRCPF